MVGREGRIQCLGGGGKSLLGVAYPSRRDGEMFWGDFYLSFSFPGMMVC